MTYRCTQCNGGRFRQTRAGGLSAMDKIVAEQLCEDCFALFRNGNLGTGVSHAAPRRIVRDMSIMYSTSRPEGLWTIRAATPGTHNTDVFKVLPEEALQLWRALGHLLTRTEMLPSDEDFEEYRESIMREMG